MQQALEHFRQIDRKLESERVAWNSRTSSIADRINVESANLAILQSQPKTDPKELARAKKAVDQLKQERAGLRAPSFVNPLPDVEKYARTHSKDASEPLRVHLPPGQTFAAVHHNLSEKTDAILASISRVNSAPIDDVAAIERQIDALATPPRVANGRLFFPKQLARAQNGAAITVTNVDGLLCWLFKDMLIEAAKKLTGDAGVTMAPEERQEALDDLYSDFALALRLESAAAMEAEKSGQSIIRRRHVHPAVLLGVTADAKAIYQWHADRKGA